MHAKLPECYSFLRKEGMEAVNAALLISKETHATRMQEYKSCVNTYQYATGGECIHRGYYCPSLIKDIVTGNCNRGKLIKNPARVKRGISYEYGFCDDKLLLIRNMDLSETEYIFHSDGKQTGYTFDSKMVLRTITECTYAHGRLMRYFLIHLDFSGSIYSCEKEIYEYGDGDLQSVIRFILPTTNCCSHEKYVFRHNSEGFLSSYKAIEFENGAEKESYYWKDHWFPVSIRRRV